MLWFVGLLLAGLIVGQLLEHGHFRSLQRREAELAHVKVLTQRQVIPVGAVDARLLCASVVVSIDYFKRIMALIRSVFGGRLGSYESLLQRARREAIVRLQAQAQQAGANLIIATRLQTASISNNASGEGGIGSVEVLAYGTALRTPQ